MLLLDRLGHALAMARRERKLLAFIDLDNFKTINDSKGHPAGDALLLRSRRDSPLACARATPSRGWAARVTIVLPHIAHMKDMIAAAKLLDRFRHSFEVNDHAEHTSASVGSACTLDGDTPEALIEAADAAMYRVKQSGGDG
jgi:diguanylate cyclase (GGDEF)-like protein